MSKWSFIIVHYALRATLHTEYNKVNKILVSVCLVTPDIFALNSQINLFAFYSTYFHISNIFHRYKISTNSYYYQYKVWCTGNLFGNQCTLYCTVLFLKEKYFFKWGFLWYSSLLYLSPLRFHCVGGCWDWTRTNITWSLDVLSSIVINFQYIEKTSWRYIYIELVWIPSPDHLPLHWGRG